jgi:hypothetical protein
VGWFLSYSVQHNLHDTAEKQDKGQYTRLWWLRPLGIEKAAEQKKIGLACPWLRSAAVANLRNKLIITWFPLNNQLALLQG